MIEQLATLHSVIQVTPSRTVDDDFSREGRRLQDLMRSDDVVEFVTLPWAPSIHRDPTYTDVVVVWDHGDSPHNPMAFDDPQNWRQHRCVPPAVWDYVAGVVDAHNYTDTYCWVWLRSEEVGVEDDVPRDASASLGSNALSTLRRCLHDLSGTVDEGRAFKERLAAEKDELQQRARALAQQIDNISLMLARQAYPDQKFDRPLFFDCYPPEAPLGQPLPTVRAVVQTEGSGFDEKIAHVAVSPARAGGIPFSSSLIAHNAVLRVWPEGRWCLDTNIRKGMSTLNEVIEWYASHLKAKRACQ